MRFCWQQTLLIVLGALAVGVLTFFLLFTGALTLVPTSASGIVFFAVTELVSAGVLLALTLGLLLSDRTPALADAWLCCGETAGFGALGAFLTALITSLSAFLEVGLYIGVALLFFFLTVLFGGLLCFLRRYVTARFNSGC